MMENVRYFMVQEEPKEPFSLLGMSVGGALWGGLVALAVGNVAFGVGALLWRLGLVSWM